MEVFSNWTESNFRAGSLVRATEDCSLLCIHATRRNRHRDSLLEPSLRPQLVLPCNTSWGVRNAYYVMRLRAYQVSLNDVPRPSYMPPLQAWKSGCLSSPCPKLKAR